MIQIVYEDAEIFVVNKRQGLAVQGGAGISHSVDSDLAAQVGQKIYLVHRLDKETSGLLLCAKNPAAAAKWTRVIGEKSAEKEYKALCFGTMKNPRGKICSEIVERGVKKRAETFYETEEVFEIPWQDSGGNAFGNRGDEIGGKNRGEIGGNSSKGNSHEKDCAIRAKNDLRGNAFEKCGDGGGKDCAKNGLREKDCGENPRAESKLSEGDFSRKLSLLRLRLGTGRTHQIRIHLAGEGLPICGDDKYGDFAANRLFKKKFGIKRLCLCAFRLTLPLADGRRTFEIEAEFSKALEAMRA